MICDICPRNCGVERGKGFCGMGDDVLIARAAPHFDEEPVISGTKGSGAVFFSGCSLKCAFCQNIEISHGRYGKRVEAEKLPDIYNGLADRGVHNINMVNPTHYTEQIIESLKHFDRLPIVWNTGGYEKAETIKRLDGLVNVYLPDMKYADDDLAKRYSGAGDYFEYASAALKEMLRQRGSAVIDENGIMTSGVIVRHLVLPGQLENTKRVIDWFAENMQGAYFSLMAQYMPYGNVDGLDELGRRLMRDEYDEVCDYLIDAGIEDGFMQELEASDEKYIPKWDLTGVD